MLSHVNPDSNAGISSAEPIKPNASRFGHFNEFIDRGQAHLRSLGCASASMLWVTLWRFESAQDRLVRVGLARLSECYGTDKRNIVRMLAQLETHGYLLTVDAGRPGRGSHCATYRLTLPVKGVVVTPLLIGVTTTPLGRAKVSPRRVKGVVVTPVQKGTEKKEGKRARRTPENFPPEPAEKTPAKGVDEHRQAVAIFCDAWAAKYAAKYPFNGGKDGTAIKAILAHLDGDATAFAAVVARFFADVDPWLANNRHALGVLRSQLAKWLTDEPRPLAARPMDFAGKTESRIAAQIAEALQAPDYLPRQGAEADSPRAVLQLAARAPTRPEQVPIPRELDTPAFRDSWRTWLADSQRRYPTPKFVAAELEKLTALGAEAATRLVDSALARSAKTLGL